MHPIRNFIVSCKLKDCALKELLRIEDGITENLTRQRVVDDDRFGDAWCCSIDDALCNEDMGSLLL